MSKEYSLDYDSINQFVQVLFNENNMFLDKNGWYEGGKFETIGVILHVLISQKWFESCVCKLYWYDEESGGIEDVLYYQKYGEVRYVSHA